MNPDPLSWITVFLLFFFFFFTILLLNRLQIKYSVGQNFGEVEFASKFGLPL